LWFLAGKSAKWHHWYVSTWYYLLLELIVARGILWPTSYFSVIQACIFSVVVDAVFADGGFITRRDVAVGHWVVTGVRKAVAIHTMQVWKCLNLKMQNGYY
jgi:hypothetical protein